MKKKKNIKKCNNKNSSLNNKNIIYYKMTIITNRDKDGNCVSTEIIDLKKCE